MSNVPFPGLLQGVPGLCVEGRGMLSHVFHPGYPGPAAQSEESRPGAAAKRHLSFVTS